MQTKTCTKCHTEKPISDFKKAKNGKFGVASVCSNCRKIIYLSNKENILKQKKEYHKKNKSKILETKKIYYSLNKEKILLRLQKYYLINKQNILSIRKTYLKTAKGKAVDKAKAHKRRIAKQNGKNFSYEDVLKLFELQSGKCVYCECKLHKSGNNKYHIDHIQPLSKGGSNGIENIQLLCKTCNLSKHAKLPQEFAQNFGKLF